MHNIYKRMLGYKWVLKQVEQCPAPSKPCPAPPKLAAVAIAKHKNISAKNYKLIIIGPSITSLQDLHQNQPEQLLLKKIIQAMKLDWKNEVYIHNTSNTSNIEPCSFQFIKENSLSAQAICLFGTQSIKSEFVPNLAINKLRRQNLHYNNIPIIVTFSLPYILRNPDVKPLVWSDLQRIITILQ